MLKKRRFTQIEKDAAFIVAFLNETPSAEAERRLIESLLRDLASLSLAPVETFQVASLADVRSAVELIKSNPALYDQMDLQQIYSRLQPLQPETIRRLDPKDARTVERISQSLKDYVFVPEVRVVLSANAPRCYFQLCPAGMKTMDRTRVLFEGRKGAVSNLGIGWIILAVSEVARSGGIDRLRQCSCSRWFFAKPSTMISCGQRCRRSKHDTGHRKPRTDYNREYMRKYRAKNKKK